MKHIFSIILLSFLVSCQEEIIPDTELKKIALQQTFNTAAIQNIEKLEPVFQFFNLHKDEFLKANPQEVVHFEGDSMVSKFEKAKSLNIQIYNDSLQQINIPKQLQKSVNQLLDSVKKESFFEHDKYYNLEIDIDNKIELNMEGKIQAYNNSEIYLSHSIEVVTFTTNKKFSECTTCKDTLINNWFLYRISVSQQFD